MLRLVLARLAIGTVTLWAASLVVFLGIEPLPGNAATAALGQSATPESVRALEQQFGLDRPVLTRYFEWLGNIVQGNLGKSLPSGDPVSEVILPALAHTAVLAAITTVILIPLGVGFGILSAVRRDR